MDRVLFSCQRMSVAIDYVRWQFYYGLHLTTPTAVADCRVSKRKYRRHLCGVFVLSVNTVGSMFCSKEINYFLRKYDYISRPTKFSEQYSEQKQD